LGDVNAIGGLTALTVAFTARFYTLSNKVIITQWGNAAGEQAFIIGITDTDEITIVVHGGVAYRGRKTSGFNLVINRLYRFVHTYRASDQLTEIWIDGVKPTLADNNTGSPASLTNSTSALQVGHETDEAVDGEDMEISEVAIWGSRLSDGEAGAYGRGRSAATIRPSGLLVYAPMRTTNDLYDRVRRVRGVATGAANAPHPRVFYPLAPVRAPSITQPIEIDQPAPIEIDVAFPGGELSYNQLAEQPAPISILVTLPGGTIAVPLAITQPAPILITIAMPGGLAWNREIAQPAPILITVAFPGGFVAFPRTFNQPAPIVIAVAFPGGHLVTGSGRLVRLGRSYGVFVHEPWWPGRRIAELTSAFSVDCTFERMAQGQAALRLNRSDAQARSDVLRYGNLLVIEMPDQPTWAGPILTIEQAAGTGAIQVGAVGMAAALTGRTVPQTEVYRDSIGGGALVRSLLSRANARGHTGINLGIIENGPSVQDLPIGGQNVLQALSGEIHERTSGYEWSVRVEATPASLDAYLDWGAHQGEDRSAFVHWWQDLHFSFLNYRQDLREATQVETAIGGFGRPVALRPAVTRAASVGPQRRDLAGAEVGYISEAALRSLDDLPPGMRNERVVYEVQTDNASELDRRTLTDLERPVIATLPATFNRKADWNDIRVGNYATVHGDFGTARARVVSAQPSREDGELDAVLEVTL